MKIKTLAQFEEFLKSRVPSRANLFMGDIGLKRAKHFMKLIGNPQNKIKVIHIAGTSGKGSTAHLTSHILQSQGFSVGLSISPHIFDIRERMQINNQLPSEKMVLKYFNQILPMILKMEKTKFCMPTFFEINVGLAFFMFAQEKLDYALIETGLGGTLDATNTVTSKNKICIITKIGLDHTEILGKTIAEIAREKAGIIQKNNTTISIEQASSAQKVIQERCEMQKSNLFTINNKNNFKIISSTRQETVFDFSFSLAILDSRSAFRNDNLVFSVIPAKAGIQPPLKSPINNTHTNRNSHFHGNEEHTGLNLKNIRLGLIGKHQAENCSLALACFTILSKRDKFFIDEKLLRNILRGIKISGRLEIHKIKKQTLIIDGAHNPQKIQSLTSNLSLMFPKQKFTFIVAFKKGKDFKQMLKKIIPLADKILLTQFSTSNMDNHWISIDNLEISKFLIKEGFKKFEIIENKKSEIKKVIQKSKKPVIITGSLYLISSIYHF